MVKNILGVFAGLIAATIWVILANQFGVEDSFLTTMISSALAVTVYCALYYAGRKPERPTDPATNQD